MGCYGLGPSRLMGAIVECMGDDKGLIWPESVAPYMVGIVNLKQGQEQTDRVCEDVYAKLTAAGIEVVYDDRSESAGVKFADMDLIGLPWHLVVGPRGLEKNVVELKNRMTGAREEFGFDSVLAKLTKK
jgi:prolyl-tRNA synthetase